MLFSLPVLLFLFLIVFLVGAIILQQGIFIIALFLVLWALLYFLAHRFFNVPLKALRDSLREVGEGNFDITLKKASTAEMSEVFTVFNEMSSQLQDIKTRDERVSRLKSEFITITAHQLRTPLSALKWVLHMALAGDVGPLKDAQKELLDKGYKSTERMITLVNDLLDVIAIEEGRFAYAFKKGDVAKVIESVVQEAKGVASKKGVTLVFHKPAHIIPTVALDAQKFRLAISNVIDNAVRYTMKEGRVDVELTIHEDELLILVKDTGIGIPKEHIDRLFTKFFRAQNALKMETEGSGLGLFIAKNIIEKHGGEIWLESEEGKGTTAYITIPASDEVAHAKVEEFLGSV